MGFDLLGAGKNTFPFYVDFEILAAIFRHTGNNSWKKEFDVPRGKIIAKQNGNNKAKLSGPYYQS